MDYVILRILCSFICGVLISQTGSFIQLGTLNILASPSTLGFDGVAILWMLVFHSALLYFGWAHNPLYFLLSGLPLFVLFGFSFTKMLKGKMRFERLVLLGLTFNLFVGVIFSLWQFLFLAFNLPFPIELWFGHFRFVHSQALLILILAELLLLVGLRYFWNELNLFSLGEGISQNWKLKEKSLYAFLFLSVSLATFVVVSLFGAFSFLGLIFPIVARELWFTKFDLKGELLWGSLVNGLFLMVMDYLCYQFPIFGAEIPVGLIVTAVGAVSLIVLLWNASDRPFHPHSELLAKPRK